MLFAVKNCCNPLECVIKYSYCNSGRPNMPLTHYKINARRKGHTVYAAVRPTYKYERIFIQSRGITALCDKRDT